MSWAWIFWVILGLCLFVYGFQYASGIGLVYSWVPVSFGTMAAGILCLFRAKGT